MNADRRVFLSGLGALLMVPVVLHGQDPLPPIDQGVRIGITYTPGVRPGMMILRADAGEIVDSVEAILSRDLDYSDQFEMITLPGGELLSTVRPAGDSNGGAGVRFVNYSLYAALGADFVVEVEPVDSLRVIVTLYDVYGQQEKTRVSVVLGQVVNPAFRMVAHDIADQFVVAAVGELGYAASSLLFVRNQRLLMIDSDGGALRSAAPAEDSVYSPVWDRSGARFIYTSFTARGGELVLTDRTTNSRRTIPGTDEYTNFATTISPSGEEIAFARSDGAGTHVYSYNLARGCCLQRLTLDRFSDNLSPTFSPDGRRIAFVSDRPGLPQIYVMAADGTGQELFAPMDWGVTGSSYAPEWSPDGTKIVFHRDVNRSPQLFILDTRSKEVRQLTSFGRNEDPTWAPDSRHIAFVSDRTGSSQLWIIDLETGRVRQLTRIGGVRLPAWSPLLSETTTP